MYSYIIEIERITGNKDEEIFTLGVSAKEAQQQVTITEQLQMY